jgi:hypothetical protein
MNLLSKIKNFFKKLFKKEEKEVRVTKQFLPLTKETIAVAPKALMFERGILQGDLGEAREKLRTYEDIVKVKRELDLEKILEENLEKEANKIISLGQSTILSKPVKLFSFPDDGEFIGYATHFYWYKDGFYIRFFNEKGEDLILGGEPFDKVITFPRFFSEHIKKEVLFINYTVDGKFIEPLKVFA